MEIDYMSPAGRPARDPDLPAICPKCGRELPTTEEFWYFYPSKQSYHNGMRRSARCRDCEKDRVNERLSQKMDSDPEFAERRRQKQLAATQRRRGEKKLTYAEVARQVGLTREGIRQMVASHRLSWPPTEEELERLKNRT